MTLPSGWSGTGTLADPFTAPAGSGAWNVEGLIDELPSNTQRDFYIKTTTNASSRWICRIEWQPQAEGKIRARIDNHERSSGSSQSNGWASSTTNSTISSGQSVICRIRNENNDDLDDLTTFSYFFYRYNTTKPSLPAPPDPPTAPAISNITADGFTATVTAISGATSYTFYTSTSSTVTTSDTSHTSNTNSKVITGLNAGTTYYVAATATNNIGESNIGSATSQLLAPAKPSSPTVTEIGATTANFSTTAVTGATKYKWTATPSSGSAVTAETTTAAASITGLVASTAYNAKVVANNATGDSPASAQTAFTTLAVQPSPSGTPGNVTIAATTPFDYEGSASPGTFLSQRCTVTIGSVQYADSYDLQISDTESGLSTATILNTTNRVFAITSRYFQQGKTYYARARGKNSQGDGSWTSTITLVSPVTAIPVPPAPTITRILNVLTATYTAPTNFGGTIMYVGRNATASIDTKITGVTATAQTTVTVTGIPGNTYYFVYAYVVGTEQGENSANGSIAIPVLPPKKPASPRVILRGEVSLAFRVSRASGDETPITNWIFHLLAGELVLSNLAIPSRNIPAPPNQSRILLGTTEQFQIVNSGDPSKLADILLVVDSVVGAEAVIELSIYPPEGLGISTTATATTSRRVTTGGNYRFVFSSPLNLTLGQSFYIGIKCTTGSCYMKTLTNSEDLVTFAANGWGKPGNLLIRPFVQQNSTLQLSIDRSTDFKTETATKRQAFFFGLLRDTFYDCLVSATNSAGTSEPVEIPTSTLSRAELTSPFLRVRENMFEAMLRSLGQEVQLDGVPIKAVVGGQEAARFTETTAGPQPSLLGLVVLVKLLDANGELALPKLPLPNDQTNRLESPDVIGISGQLYQIERMEWDGENSLKLIVIPAEGYAGLTQPNWWPL